MPQVRESIELRATFQAPAAEDLRLGKKTVPAEVEKRDFRYLLYRRFSPDLQLSGFKRLLLPPRRHHGDFRFVGNAGSGIKTNGSCWDSCYCIR